MSLKIHFDCSADQATDLRKLPLGRSAVRLAFRRMCLKMCAYSRHLVLTNSSQGANIRPTATMHSDLTTRSIILGLEPP